MSGTNGMWEGLVRENAGKWTSVSGGLFSSLLSLCYVCVVVGGAHTPQMNKREKSEEEYRHNPRLTVFMRLNLCVLVLMPTD